MKKENMNNEEKKKRKHGRLVEQIADGMKRIADDTKQNKKRQKTVMHMEKKEEKWSKSRANERMVDRLDRISCWSIAFVAELRRNKRPMLR
ncbi:conserved hypothetical protein [Trichinella spiralis]|uniref:hypothetical protein n=1 Tax=Trichinella spiralis TaxID=6334 RepID=UPI0001EFCFFE|nr:conserved hypothetical protein [Trichinella spiralis]